MKPKSLPPFLKGAAGAALDDADGDEPMPARRAFLGARKGMGTPASPPVLAIHVHLPTSAPKRAFAPIRKKGK